MTALEQPTAPTKKKRITEKRLNELLQKERELKIIEHLLNADRCNEAGISLPARVQAVIESRRKAQYALIGKRFDEAKKRRQSKVIET